MTARQVLEALTELGVTLMVADGKPTLKKPPGFAGEGRLALLMPALKAHRAAIIEMHQAVEPWECRECARTFFAARAEVRELYVGKSPHWCPSRSCPQMRG